MQIYAVIPARYASTRFPGKPLARETGKFLIEHVYERALESKHIDRCYVATDDQRIFDAVKSFGGNAVMTRADHPSGTDRIAEVAQQLGGAADDLIINVQGDEPEIEPAYLDRLIDRMRSRPEAPIGTLACPFPVDADPSDPNCVKVVRNLSGEAIYFSRAWIPYPRDGVANAARSGACHLHLGVYAYRREFLLELTSWRPTPLEQIEKLEQLRVLEHGRQLLVEIVESASVGIDTPQEYGAFVARFKTRHGR